MLWMPLYNKEVDMKLKQLTTNALLTAIALTIFMLEAQIPSPVPIPGIKLGLANIITLFALFAYTPKDALLILLVRVFLGSVFSGQISTLLYSLSGGLFCMGAILILRRFISDQQLWVASIIGAVFHNIGQIIVAILVTGTPRIIVYLPVLMISGIAAGLFTGLGTQFLYNKLKQSKLF